MTLDLFQPAAGPEPKPHPAAWSLPLIEALRSIVPPGLVVDPFGGTGRLGLLGPKWRVLCGDLEPEWIGQAWRYGATGLRWDATALPLATGSVPAVVTSPAYGNRLADSYAYDPAGYQGRKSDGTRRSYRGFLGRTLSDGSGACLQWGDAYKALHARALAEFVRVLAPGGTLVINMKDHIRAGQLQRVCEWWAGSMEACGFVVTRRRIALAGHQNLARARAQGRPVVDYEELIVGLAP